MEIKIGLSLQSRQTISSGLATLLANTYTIYLTTQNFHWNAAGREFFNYHILFEKQYEELAQAVDEIAERVRALGHYVDGTFAGFQNLATVNQVDKVLNIKEMLHHLIEAHEHLICHARTLAGIADREGDFATVDMIGRRLGSHEKMVWFLRSSL